MENSERRSAISASPPHLIEVSLHQVLDDARYGVENNTYPPDELAVRFHNRLVSVHPFPNGNGRWSRLAADVFVVQLGGKRFTWGGAATLHDHELAKSSLWQIPGKVPHHNKELIAGFVPKRFERDGFPIKVRSQRDAAPRDGEFLWLVS